jgi:hypothetical protein
MTQLMDKMLSGTDAWSREARRVWEQATRLGLALDEEELALLDVCDLQALRVSIEGRHSIPTRPAMLGMLAHRMLRSIGSSVIVHPVSNQ